MIFKDAPGKLKGTKTFVLSDGSVDRYGDTINPDGWVLKNFKKNPIALFGHAAGFPVGTWEHVRVENGQLLGDYQPAQRGTSARIDEINSLIEQNILKTVSVGFAPIESEPLNEKDPYGPKQYIRQELLETSIVSVPANPNALQVAKSLGISEETLELAFGVQAEPGRNLGRTGVQATRKASLPGLSRGEIGGHHKGTNPMSLSDRIQALEAQLVEKKDLLTELTKADDIDDESIEAVNSDIDDAQKKLNALKSAEARIGLEAMSTAVVKKVPAEVRRPLMQGSEKLDGMDLLVKGMVARGIAHFAKTPLDDVLHERYRDLEALSVIVKADQTIGTTTVSGWASELVQTVNSGFLQALQPVSIYPALRSRGIALNFDGLGTLSLPSRTAGGAGGGFVAEGSPIRVGRITTAATTMTPRKLGVIVPFSRELTKRATPAIEALVRQAVLEDTAAILDAAIVDATASSTARPAGLLNGVSAASTGYGGTDYQAVLADFKALASPFYTANAADNITVLMNPIQGLAISMMPGPVDAGFGWFGAIGQRFTILESTTVPANRLIALRNSDFATAMGDTPEFDVSETATVHMEDTTPLEIVSTTPTSADPVRSFFQTATIGVRMMMDVSWKMRRSGMVSWIDTTQW